MPEYLTDGLSSVLGGCDTSRNPCLLGPDEISFSINASLRGGFLRPRPGIDQVRLTWNSSLVEERQKDGRFQVADYFNPDDGPECIIASIGGRQFRFNVASDNSVQEITITHQMLTTANFVPPAVGANVLIQVETSVPLGVGSVILVNGKNYQVLSISSPTAIIAQNIDDDGSTNPVPSGSSIVYYEPNSSTIDQGWMQQAESWIILQDGQSLPWIYDGASARRSVPSENEIKTGRMMAYVMGRLWYALPDGRSFRAGDLVGSSSGTPPTRRDAVLRETENAYLNGGGDFFTPTTSGGIRALKALAIPDTSFGQGPLLVITPNQIYSVNSPVDRTVWQALENPIQTISLISYGGLSHYGTILVNGDVMFRSLDGVRSYILARREYTTWGNTPISREMDRVIKYDDIKLLDHCSAVLFDNRVHFTVSPVRTNHGTYHRGWIALDLDLISSMKGKSSPSWSGLNTGLNVLQFVKGEFNKVERCFAFGLNYEQEIELYEFTKDGKFDHQNDTERDIPINWVVETRAFTFGTAIFPQQRVLKNLLNLEMEIDEVVGTVSFKVYFRPDNHPCWILWSEFSECQTYKNCAIDPLTGCQTNKNYKPGFRPKLSIGQPPNDCDENTHRPFRLGYQFQIRLEISGYCEIKNIVLKAEPKQEQLYQNVKGCA